MQLGTQHKPSELNRYTQLGESLDVKGLYFIFVCIPSINRET